MDAIQLLAQADTAVDSIAVNSVLDFMLKGGVMMVPIGVCSLVVLAVVVERLIVLRHSKIIPPGFVDGLDKILSRGLQAKSKASTYCTDNDSPIAEILAAGVGQLGRAPERVEKHLAATGEMVVFRLRKRLRVLSVIAAVTPLMGLVGTIFGMIKAFQTVAVSADALGKTEMLAEGIYEAMITTAAGLLVAIPTLILYHWIVGKIEHAVQEMDTISVEFVEAHVYKDAASQAPASGAAEDAAGSNGSPVESAEPAVEAV